MGTSRTTLLVWCTLICASLLVAEPASSQNQSSGNSKPGATPESAMREFMLGMLSHDLKVIQRVVLPLDPAELEWLVRGEKLSKDQRRDMKVIVDRLPIQVFKVGDSVRMPDGTRFKLTEDDVNEDHAVAKFGPEPMSYRLRRVKNVWLVDAEPVVAARKAAAKAKEASAGVDQ